MLEACDINIMVSNILSEKPYSHCRLCLKIIKEQYVRFDDAVSVYPDSGVYQPLSEVLSKFLGDDVCDVISGVEAVCIECVDTALKSARFIDKCHSSSNILSQVFENLSNTFNTDINIADRNKSLYLVIDNLESSYLLVNKPQKKQKSGAPCYAFLCNSCDENFDAYVDIKAHNLAVHGMLTCDKCMDTFLNDTDLSTHESVSHKYRCAQCPHYWSTEEGIKDHEDRVHNVYVCKECGKPCNGLNKLNIHEDKHKAKHSCPKCGKSYTTKEFFEKHVLLCLKNLIDPHPIRSSMDKTYSCPKCDKAYSTPGGLRVHNRFTHGDAKPHVCPECGKKFTAPSYLKVHMIKHTGEKNFKCDRCNSRFVSKEALLYHTRRHTGEKPYSCKHCSERFVNASSRAEHIKFKHVGPTLMCEICSKKFVTTHFLKQHISRHHDPTSKLYYGRSAMPANLPSEQNMRTFFIKTEN